MRLPNARIWVPNARIWVREGELGKKIFRDREGEVIEIECQEHKTSTIGQRGGLEFSTKILQKRQFESLKMIRKNILELKGFFNLKKYWVKIKLP